MCARGHRRSLGHFILHANSTGPGEYLCGCGRCHCESLSPASLITVCVCLRVRVHVCARYGESAHRPTSRGCRGEGLLGER